MDIASNKNYGVKKWLLELLPSSSCPLRNLLKKENTLSSLLVFPNDCWQDRLFDWLFLGIVPLAF